MASPNITLTGTLNDISGVANAGTVTVTLVGYGANLPRIAGTAVLAPITVSATANGSGVFSLPLWGNDQITVAGVTSTTYYDIEVKSAAGSSLGHYAFQLTGSGSVDLSNLTQYTSTPVLPGLPNAVVTNPTGIQTISTYALNVPSLGIGQTAITSSATAPRTLTLPDANAVVPQVLAPVAHQFVTGINGSGILSAAQPAFSDISGSLANSQLTFPVLAPDGTSVAPSYAFASNTKAGFYADINGAHFTGTNGIVCTFNNNTWLQVNNLIDLGAAADVLLVRDGAAIFAQKNGTNAQEHRIYGTTTGPQYLSLKHNGTSGIIDVIGGGHVVSNQIIEMAGGKSIIFDGATSGTTSVLPQAVASGTLTLPAATDTLVGRATADTLTNKTLTGASSGNSVSLLFYQGATGNITGNSTDETVFTYTLPANTLGIGKGIRVKWAVVLNNAVSCTFKLFFGSNSRSFTDSANTQKTGELLVFNNGATNVQSAYDFPTISNNTILTNQWGDRGALAIDTTAPVVIKMTANLASPNTVTGLLFVVELLQ